MSDETPTALLVVITEVDTEAPLEDATEVLFRQVHPDLYDDGRLASSAFLPSPGDQNQLSTDRASMTTAKEAHQRYIESKRRSVGTFGVTVGECSQQGLRCFPDPVAETESTKANPAHSRVDFSVLGTNQQRKVAKRLKQAAVTRGILYSP